MGGSNSRASQYVRRFPFPMKSTCSRALALYLGMLKAEAARIRTRLWLNPATTTMVHTHKLGSAARPRPAAPHAKIRHTFSHFAVLTA